MKRWSPATCNQVQLLSSWKKPFDGGMTAWRLDQRWFVGLERLSRRSGLAILLIGLLSFIGSASVSMVRGYRLPRVHDEFCYSLLAALPLLIWQRWQLLALLNCTGLVVLTMYTQGGWPRYPAPMTGLLYAILAQCLRLCGLSRIGNRHIGKYLVSMIVLACIAGAAILIASDVRDTQGGFPTQRSEIIQTLVARDGRDLVIVRYGSSHSVHQEWVLNRADIDGSEIVWARDMDCKLNHELIEYFHDRRIWLLQVEDEASIPKLLPFETDVDQCNQETH
jgi:hypothetical protein